MSEKLVYVPRNWKVSYVDEKGNEHENVALRANGVYRIVEDGIPYNATVSGIRVEEDKTYIVAKVLMYPGFMNVMEKVEDRRFDVNKVTEITRVAVNYNKTYRSMRDKSSNNDIFTFAFDSDKYPNSQYRISVYAGEFVALAVKDPRDSNQKSRSIYGHIVDVNPKTNEIKMSRYASNRGVRNVFDYTVKLESLLGIYRYELEIAEFVERKETHEVDAVEEAAATEE